MKLSIVLSIQPAQFQAATFRGDLETNLAYIAGLGYDGVELAIRDPELLDVDELESLVLKHKLTVPAIGTGQAWGEDGLSFTDPAPSVRRAAIERVKDHVPVAARFNAIVIIGLLRGIVRPGVDHAEAMSWLAEALQECTAAASLADVRLALEPINRYETTLVNTVAQGLDLLERVGAINLGLLLDTFHMNIEEPSIENSIRQAGDRLFHFHVADSNRWHPGAGHLDFRSLLAALDSTGYTGFISGEFMPMPDALAGARRAIEYLRAIGSRGTRWPWRSFKEHCSDC